MYYPAIVIIAYNRADSLKRLLSSVKAADFPKDNPVALVISIDKGDNPEVAVAAREFEWTYGEKRIVEHKERLGLKRHVLECSGYSLEYGSAILLEDDLYVAPDFYEFARKALEFSDSDERIAGVSLYNHRLNVHAREPFEAIDDGFDNWYFRFASSWGQAYTAKQWKAFAAWMEKNDTTPFPDSVPENVRSWGESSWLKYFIRYVVEKDLFFLYPRVSRTTNFSEAGTHRMGQVADLQVPLGRAPVSGEYRFSTTEESGSKYDAYFENRDLEDIFDRPAVVDLYGKKPVPEDGGYFLSCRRLPFRVVKSFGRLLRPIDANIFGDIEGEAFFLYDTSVSGKPPAIKDSDRLLYNYRAYKVKHGLSILLRRLFG